MKKDKMQIFVSHCCDDKRIMKTFHNTVALVLLGEAKVYSSFTDENSTRASEYLSPELRKNLSESSVMIAIITDSYLRSEVCIAEISTFWFQKKPVIPIVFNDSIGKDFLRRVFHEDLIYIDAELSPEVCATKLIKALEKYRIRVYNEKKDRLRVKATRFFFKCAKQSEATRAYIGSGTYYNTVVQFCQQSGIEKLDINSIPLDEIKKNLYNKDEVIMLGTTLNNIIDQLTTTYISNLVIRGSEITILVPNKESDYISDIALIETPFSHELKRDELKKEFDCMVDNLILNVQAANNSKLKNTSSVYHINLGCSRTLLRQTVILGRKGERVWGICSFNIPPVKPINGTPTIVFSGSLKKDATAKTLYNYVDSIRKIAKNSGKETWFEITSDTKPEEIKFDTALNL